MSKVMSMIEIIETKKANVVAKIEEMELDQAQYIDELNEAYAQLRILEDVIAEYELQ